MTQAASAADALEYRARRRETRDVSHRFRRGPRVWTRAPVLALAVAVVALLVFAFRSDPPRSQPRFAAAIPQAPAPAPLAAPVTAPAPAVASGPAFRIQVASFLEPRNAARMVQQLRGEGLAVESLVVETRRVRYRVLAPIEDAGDTEPLLARLRELGFSPRLASDVVAVTEFVPTPVADDAAGRLEEEGIAVRVEEENQAVSYHVVRVGAYPTAEAAERGRDELAARGLKGHVVQVQPEADPIEP